MLDKYEKKLLLLDIVGAWKEFMTVLKEILAIVYIVIENLAFFDPIDYLYLFINT